MSFDFAKIEFRLRGNRVSATLNCRKVEIQLPLVVVSQVLSLYE
ncbi:MAG: hypothetical protein V7L20_06670 [Nostoc sp.]